MYHFQYKKENHPYLHRLREVLNIVWWGGGGGGGGKVQNMGGGGGGKERGEAKLFGGFKLIGAPAPNQRKIITFLTLKTDNIAKLRMKLKSILLEIPSNKIKGTYIKLIHL